ncbi:hypothetical protein MRF4_21695 [Methylobacterium radiotolerans]
MRWIKPPAAAVADRGARWGRRRRESAGTRDARRRVGVRKVSRDGYRYWKAGIVTAASVPLAASKRACPGSGQLDRELSV